MSENDWKDVHQLRRKIHLQDTPEDPIIDDKVYEEQMKGQMNILKLDIFIYGIYDNKDLVGTFFFGFFNEKAPSYKTNEKLALFDIELLKEYRRKGIGTQAIKIMIDICDKNNRSLFITDSKIPESNKFFQAIGAQVAQKGDENRLQFADIDWQLIDQWIIEGKQVNPKTKIITLVGSIPETYIDEFVKSYNETSNLQPKDELQVGEIIITKEEFRKLEQTGEEGKILTITSMTVEETGEISGFTQLRRLPGKEKLLSQGLTGVPIKHRGRKLGKWVKAAMLNYVKENYPDTEAIVTGNAESNDAMLHINRKLGFKKHREVVAAQVTLDQLKAYIGTKPDLEIQIIS